MTVKTKKRLFHLLGLIFVLSIFVITHQGCSKLLDKKDDVESASTTDDNSSDTIPSIEYVVKIGLTSFGSLLDEQADESLGAATLRLNNLNSYAIFVSDLIMKNAFAAECSERAFMQVCATGTKSISYSDCTIPGTTLALTGTVNLNYSDTVACALSTEGQTVTRTFTSLSRTSYLGGKVDITSDNHTDYRGNTIGGGAKLTKTAAGWTLQLLGTRRAHNNNFFNLSFRTTSDINVTGTLARSGRILNGGALEIINNNKEFVTKLSPNNLEYSASCCYPTGGAIDVAFEGKRTGSGTITFIECGKIEFTDDNGVEIIEINTDSCF